MTTPAPRLPIPNGRQLTLHLTQHSQKAAIVLGALDDGVQGDLSALAVAWRDAAWALVKPLAVTGVVCTGATMRNVAGADFEVYEVGAPTANTGDLAGSPALANGSTLIRWNTNVGGRSGKGRTFVPGLSTQYVNSDGRTYGTNYTAIVNGAITAYLGAAFWTAENHKPAVLSFSRGAARPIASGSLASVIGTQRRRMR